LARRQVTVIAVGGHDATFAATTATTTIPVVFIAADDPVRLGLVSSLARPGGNLTGINILMSEMATKRLDLLHELMPGAARVAALLNPANVTTTRAMLGDLESAARALAGSAVW
jgi:putative ABC transport system substrate-binding protein